jgi:hypothetical protein
LTLWNVHYRRTLMGARIVPCLDPRKRILPPQVFSPVTSVKMRLLPPPPLWLVTDPIMQ